jgi:hypothetical protein
MRRGNQNLSVDEGCKAQLENVVIFTLISASQVFHPWCKGGVNAKRVPFVLLLSSVSPQSLGTETFQHRPFHSSRPFNNPAEQSSLHTLKLRHKHGGMHPCGFRKHLRFGTCYA